MKLYFLSDAEFTYITVFPRGYSIGFYFLHGGKAIASVLSALYCSKVKNYSSEGNLQSGSNAAFRPSEILYPVLALSSEKC